MVFEPPRHGKSEEVSRLFSAYYLYRHPDRWVGVNSYSSDLAFTLSRAARENYQEGGGKVKYDAAAVKHWETPEGGGFWAAGVGGPITGKGFHLGIIDDPLKNAEEAASENIREKQKDWYQSTFLTREEPAGAVIVIQTRWHEDDLSGWLLSGGGSDPEDLPEPWHVVNFPAIYEGEASFPAHVTSEPDGREVGQALCPSRYPVPKLRRIEGEIGGYYWDALYQQRPTAKLGDFFKVEGLEILPAAPAGLRMVRAWDEGATESGGDYTAGVKIGTRGDGLFYVLDVRRGQWGPDKVDATIKQTAQLDGVFCSVRGAQDPGAAGKKSAQAFTRLLAGYTVETERVSGPKEARARAFASQVNAGNVRLVAGAWTADFIEELRTFPRGRHDDQIDAAADAFNYLASTPPPPQRAYSGGREQPAGYRKP